MQRVREMRYVRERKEQLRIVRACHEDKTSGHLGYRKTLARITERFTWKGVSRDAKEMVKLHSHTHMHVYNNWVSMRICVAPGGLF